MRKDTLLKKLAARSRKIDAMTDEALRTTLCSANDQCLEWADLPWVEISKPVVQKLNDLGAEAQPLLEKKRQGQLSEEERAVLATLRETYQLYYLFYQMVSPTAKRANKEKRRQEWYRTSSLDVAEAKAGVGQVEVCDLPSQADAG